MSCNTCKKIIRIRFTDLTKGFLEVNSQCPIGDTGILVTADKTRSVGAMNKKAS